jgi:hypothetical protein
MDSDARPKSTFSARNRWVIGFNVCVASMAVLALVAMVNYLSARHYLRWALTAQRQTGLSLQTLRVLRSVTNEVKVTIFFNTRENEEFHTLVTSLLREYRYVNPRIVFRTVDPVRQPADAELVLAAYKLGALKDKNFVVFDCDRRTKVIYESELADFQFEPVVGAQSHEFQKKMVSFNGEMLFTTVIFNLANPRELKVCFAQGHGEHDPERANNPHGYAKFAQILQEKINACWEKVYLQGTNDIPSDCQLLVVAGPRMPYSDQELAKIEDFLKRGGRLFALLNNMALGGRSGLEAVLAKWDVAVGDKMILDPKYSPTGNDLLTARLNNRHPVTKALLSESEDMRILLVLPRAVGQLPAAARNPDAPKVDVLAGTSDKGTEVSEIRDGVPYRNPYQDRQGDFPLAVAVEQGSVRGVSAERGSTRMIVVGDSLCLDNELIDTPPANHYFAALAVNWLLDRPQVLLDGLVPQPVKNYRLIMTRQQLQTAQAVLLAGLPGAVLLFGALVWWRRRH